MASPFEVRGLVTGNSSHGNSGRTSTSDDPPPHDKGSTGYGASPGRHDGAAAVVHATSSGYDGCALMLPLLLHLILLVAAQQTKACRVIIMT